MNKITRLAIIGAMAGLLVGSVPTSASSVYCPAGGLRITVEPPTQADVVRVDGVRVSYEVNNDQVVFDRASTGSPISMRFCVKAGPDFSSGKRTGTGYIVPTGANITRLVLYAVAG